MYGVMSQFGASRVKSNDPATSLTYMVSHAAFGITKAYVLTKIADPGLYKPHFAPLGLPEQTADTAGTQNPKAPAAAINPS
jgi:hypothetical protein